MSYANIRNVSVASQANPAHEFFQRIRDFVCKRNGTYDYSITGIGWTLHDSSYSVDEDNITNADWYVLKSVGESGNEQIYIKLIAQNAINIYAEGYMYWNNSTHAGVNKYAASAALMTFYATNAYNFSCWGDLTSFIVTADRATTYKYGCYIGKLEAVHFSDDVGAVTGALSSGSDISITVDITFPSDWIVDNKIMVMDEADLEITTIKTATPGSKNFTADLINSYSANARVCRLFCYGLTAVGNLKTNQFKPLVNVDGTVVTTSALSTPTFINLYDYIAPGDYESLICMNEMYLYSTATNKKAVYGKYRNLYIVDAALTHHNTIAENSDIYRIFEQFSNIRLAVKEV